MYAWGNSQYGQLGLKQAKEFQFATPALVKQPEWKNPKQICAGAAHALVLTQEGKVYSVGWNGFGQLGAGKQELESTHISQLAQIDGVVTKISCGNNTLKI